jgi:hypothetical protein
VASIEIKGGGSIPEKSETFTSDASPEGHKEIFRAVREYVDAWEAEAAAADAADAPAPVAADNTGDKQPA